MKLFFREIGNTITSKVLLGKLVTVLFFFFTRIPQTNFSDILLIIFIIRHKMIHALSII